MNGLDYARLTSCLQLPAQISDVHAQRIARRSEVIAPDPVADQLRGEDPPRVEHQQLQHLVLGSRQIFLALADAHGMRVGVELQLAEPQHPGVAAVQVPAHDRLQPRFELTDVVGLD